MLGLVQTSVPARAAADRTRQPHHEMLLVSLPPEGHGVMQVGWDHEEFMQCNPLVPAGSTLGSNPLPPWMENQGGQSLHPAKPVLWAGIKPAASRAEKPGHRAAGQGEIFQGKKHAWGIAGFPLFPLNRRCQDQVLSGLSPGQPSKKCLIFGSLLRNLACHGSI